jgi:hypothetical protein
LDKSCVVKHFEIGNRAFSILVVEDAKRAGLMRRVGSLREAAEALLWHRPKQEHGPRSVSDGP